jgi:CBS domain-containing protein
MEFVDDVASILEVKGEQVWTILADEMVLEAVRLMADKNVGALVVINGDGEIVGMVSERDYTRKVVLRGRSSRQTTVREIMATSVITIEPTNTVEAALRIMTRHRVRHLPVLRRGQLVGLVSIGDLVERVISEQRAALVQLESYIVGRYPG